MGVEHDILKGTDQTLTFLRLVCVAGTIWSEKVLPFPGIERGTPNHRKAARLFEGRRKAYSFLLK